jgi:hypothetical protein
MEPYEPPSTTRTYRGWLCEGSNGETEVLELSVAPAVRGMILSEQIAEDIRGYGSCLTVRYYTADEDIPADKVDEAFLHDLYGDTEASYGMNYSEYTGYLWTDDKVNVGGHDLIRELKSQIGQFLHLEISYSR